MNTTIQIADQTIGLIEVKQPNGHYLSTTVMKKGKKLITGTPTNNSFLRNEWAVNLNDYFTLDEALDDLYTLVSNSARASKRNSTFQ